MDQVEFKLSYPARELVGEGLVMILKAVTRLGVLRGEELRLAWRKASVVAVMPPNHLNLIEANPAVLFRLALCHTARRYKDKRHDKYDATQNTIPLRAGCIDAFRSRPSATPLHYISASHARRSHSNLSNHVLPFIFVRLDLRSCAEDFNQTVCNHPVFAILDLPDGKAEAVRIALTFTPAARNGGWIRSRHIRIPSAHAARARTHAPDPYRPGVRQFLHHLRASHLELRRINLPAIARRHIAQSLWVELTWTCSDAKLLHRIGNHLRPRVIHSQCGVIVLVHKDLKRLQQTEDGLFAHLAATANAIFLRAHVQQRPVDKLFPADQDA